MKQSSSNVSRTSRCVVILQKPARLFSNVSIYVNVNTIFQFDFLCQRQHFIPNFSMRQRSNSSQCIPDGQPFLTDYHFGKGRIHGTMNRVTFMTFVSQLNACQSRSLLQSKYLAKMEKYIAYTSPPSWPAMRSIA